MTETPRSPPMRWLLLLFLALLPLHSSAREFSRDFAVVFVTARTEARFGKIPLDRALLAQAIENAARSMAKGVIVKFFLDQPRQAESDRRLATSLSRLPVILQARLDDTERHPNPLPARFTVSGGPFQTAVQGNSGWIPFPALAEKSHDLGFVDFNTSRIPILENYQGKTVKSLLLCAAELAAGQPARLRPGKSVSVGTLTALLNAENQTWVDFPATSTLASFEFADLVDGTLPADALKGRVVVLAYDGPNSHTVATPFGKLAAHRAFLLLLKSFYESSSARTASIE